MKTQSSLGNQKRWAFALIVATLGACVFIEYFIPNSAELKPKLGHLTFNPFPKMTAKIAKAVQFTSPELFDAPKAPVEKIQKVSERIIDNKGHAWALGSNTAVPTIPLNKIISEYEVIEIDPHPENLPQPGEILELPMLRGQNVVVNVESNKSNPNGDKTWSGHVEGFGSDYPVIMTYGDHGVFAMITTPQGCFTMESTDGVGWLYKNPSEAELADPTQNDFLEVQLDK